ncbi:hypothetical protein RN001_002419 [Aquatica leii]|uniref:Uncharacterized protein n=1 Tax=Aquatica leii TaxID=1421715 RepID=A0AAN7PH76_9COLE|nr:hypothetical protein RN001_002419 [Aquatica leii]
MGGKGEKLTPRKCKTENVPRNSTGMSASSDVRNDNDLLVEVENADVMNFVPAVEWDSMLANNDPVAYMTSTSKIGNNVNANEPKCSDVRLYTENPLPLSNNKYVGKGSNARLYAQSTFALNKSQTKWISVGLCAELQFDPVVKLIGKEQCITILFLDEFNIARVSRGAMLVRDLTYEWYMGAEHPLSIMFEAYGDGGHQFQYVDGVFQMNDCVISYQWVSELEDLRRRFEIDAEEVYDADTVMLEETLDYILPESSVSSPSSFVYDIDNLLEDLENNSDEEDREE